VHPQQLFHLFGELEPPRHLQHDAVEIQTTMMTRTKKTKRTMTGTTNRRSCANQMMMASDKAAN
jgi:hypothetical protein